MVSEYMKSWRKRTGYNTTRRIQRQGVNLSEMIRRKNNPCLDCSNIYPQYCMEFDHVHPGTKSIGNCCNLNDFARHASCGTFIRELDKCEVVCVICHRLREFIRGGYPPPPIVISIPPVGTGISDMLQAEWSFKMSFSAIDHPDINPTQRRFLWRRQLIQLRKERPCTDCRIELPWFCMEFDHVDPSNKNRDHDGSINRIMRRAPLPILLCELDKCEVVCAMCHRERSHKSGIYQ